MCVAFVIVSWPHDGAVGQGKEHLGDAVVEHVCAAGLKIGTSTTANEQGIACKYVTVCIGWTWRIRCILPYKTHAASGMPRRVQGLDALAAKVQHIAILELAAGRADTAGIWCCRFGASVLGQAARAGDVVGMRVGLYRPDQLEVMLSQNGQVALELVIHGVDDEGGAQCFSRVFVKQHVSEGAGCGVKKLNGAHK